MAIAFPGTTNQIRDDIQVDVTIGDGFNNRSQRNNKSRTYSSSEYQKLKISLDSQEGYTHTGASGSHFANAAAAVEKDITSTTPYHQ